MSRLPVPARSGSLPFSRARRSRSPGWRKRLGPVVERLEESALLSGAASNAALQAYGQLPLRFEANQGLLNAQWKWIEQTFF